MGGSFSTPVSHKDDESIESLTQGFNIVFIGWGAKWSVVCVLQSKFFHWARFGQFVFHYFQGFAFLGKDVHWSKLWNICDGIDANWSKFQTTWNIFFFSKMLKHGIRPLKEISLHVPFSLWHLDVTRWTGMDKNGQTSTRKVGNDLMYPWIIVRWYDWTNIDTNWKRCQEGRSQKPNHDFTTCNHLEFQMKSERLWEAAVRFYKLLSQGGMAQPFPMLAKNKLIKTTGNFSLFVLSLQTKLG